MIHKEIGGQIDFFHKSLYSIVEEKEIIATLACSSKLFLSRPMNRVENKRKNSRLYGNTQQRHRPGIIQQPMSLLHSEKEYSQKKTLPWLVGYQNSTSIQGSPFALAARYGFNGTIRITEQCSNRTLYESKLLPVEKREWIPPLLAAPCGVTIGEKRCGGNYMSSPKLWPDTSTLVEDMKTTSNNTNTSSDYIKSKQLLRAITRDQQVWTEIAQKAKEERQIHCNPENEKNVKWRLRTRSQHLDKKASSGRGKIVTLR